METNAPPPPPAPAHPLWRGSDPRLWAAAHELRRRVPYLETYFPEADSERYYFWIVNHGLREHAAIVAPFLPRIPPDERQKAVFAGAELEAFLNAGCASAVAILEVQRVAGLDPFAPRRVLDFGCGCARVLRHLLPLAKVQELSGCDIDANSIAFCREAYEGARFFANGSAPPLPLAAGSVDFLFSISVFTHLARRLGDAWIAELGRVVAPGGHAAVSFHGERAWERVQSEPELRRGLGVRDQHVDAASAGWRRDGFAFAAHFTPEAYDHEEPYGLVFIRPETLPALWNGFEVVRHEKAVLGDWQDLVLFRRKAG